MKIKKSPKRNYSIETITLKHVQFLCDLARIKSIKFLSEESNKETTTLLGRLYSLEKVLGGRLFTRDVGFPNSEIKRYLLTDQMKKILPILKKINRLHQKLEETIRT